MVDEIEKAHFKLWPTFSKLYYFTPKESEMHKKIKHSQKPG